MVRLAILLVFASLATAAPSGLIYVDQAKFDARLKGFRTPEGIKLEIVASESLIRSPIAMTFAPDGTLFVLHGKTDPLAVPVEQEIHFQDGTRRIHSPIRKSTGNRVSILKFDASTGHYVSACTILDVGSANCLAIVEGWICVADADGVRRWNLKAVADRETNLQPESILRGALSDNVSLVVGPDGFLYLNSSEIAEVEGLEGKRISHASVVRFRPDGTRLESVSSLRPIFGNIVFTERYQIATITNGQFLELGESESSAAKSDSRWRHTIYYRDPALPEFFRNQAYTFSTGDQTVRGVRIGRDDAFSLLSSTDPLFRPTAIAVGPDGAIYVADARGDASEHSRIYRLTWKSGPVPGVEGPVPAINPRSMNSWELLQRTDSETGTIHSLEKTIAGPDEILAERALHELRTRLRSLKSIPEAQAPWYTDADHLRIFLQNVVRKIDDHSAVTRRLALVGLLRHWNDSVRDFFVEFLGDQDASIRRIACEGLGHFAKVGDEQSSSPLEKMLSDNSRQVRRAAVIALGQIQAPNTASVLTTVYRLDNGRDGAFTAYLHKAIDRTGNAGVVQLLDLAQSGNDESLARAVTAFVQLHSPEAIDRLPDFIANPHLSAEQRSSLIRRYSKLAASLDPLLAYMAKNPKQEAEVYLTVIESLQAKPSKSGHVGPIVTAALTIDSDALRLATLRLRDVIFDLKTLLNLIDGKVTAVVRGEALRNLHRVDPKRAAEVADRWLMSKDAALLPTAVEVAAMSPDVAIDLASKWLANKLPGNLLPQISDGLWRYRDKPNFVERRRELLTQWLRDQSQPAMVDELRQLVLKGGDASRGATAFVKAGCFDCHRVESIGQRLAPELTNTWEAHSVERLFHAIVIPGRTVASGTDPKGVLRPMPADAHAVLDFQELVNVVAFLMSRTAREGLTGVVPEFLVYSNGWSKLAVGWRGILEFKNLSKADSIVFVESRMARKVELTINITGSGELRVNGQRMRSLWNGEATFPIALREGWNVIEAKTMTSPDRHGISMRIPGEGIRFSAVSR